jgi:CDGSH-type Zn-finger protein
VLRDVLEMAGTKFACGAGYCAACRVLIDDKNARSCQVTAVEGTSVLVINAGRDARVEATWCTPYPMTLCSRGLSSSKPFCDGTHLTVDFDGTLAN